MRERNIPSKDSKTGPRPPDFHVAVDICLFSLRNDLLHIGVVQRRGQTALIDHNHLQRRPRRAQAGHLATPAERRVVEVPRDPEHHWALPGGHVGHTLLGDAYGTGTEPDPSLEAAALRVLGREAGLRLSPSDLHQIGAFGDANRDPRSGHTVSVAYMAVVPQDRDLVAHPDDAVGHVSRVQFRPVVDVLARPNRLEFDHEDILLAGIELLRRLVVTTPLATQFLLPTFTLGELRRVYEVLFHESLDGAGEAEQYAPKVRAFLQKVEAMGLGEGRELEQTVSALARLMPYPSMADEFTSDDPDVITGQHEVRVPPTRTRTRPSDLSMQAELMRKLLRQTSGIKPMRPPRLLKPLDPTNFARKVQKLGFVVPVRGASRQTFDRYGKPAALFRLDPSREAQPFLLRLDGLTKSEPDDSSD
jgi:ADP-ribose pyrophosphatase YjhB (NUDIX family)